MTDADQTDQGFDWDAGETLADRFRAHARDAQHLYGYAMRGMADDWEAGGPVWLVCRGSENAPHGAVIQLRLLAGVFRLVLTGRAPELAPYYPCLGRTEPASEAWLVMRKVIAAHVPELKQALKIAPQTNEVGRAAALLAGPFDIVGASGERRIRLLELGASAGLNLLVDRYRFEGGDWCLGPADSPVQLIGAIERPVRLQSFEIVARAGCDLHPVDVGTAAGRLLLTSFVWPFDVHRHERLAAALRVAASQPPIHIEEGGSQRMAAAGLGRGQSERTSGGLALDYPALLVECGARCGGDDLGSLRHKASACRGQHGVRSHRSAICQAQATNATLGP